MGHHPVTTTRLITCHSIIQLDLQHAFTAPALTDAQHMHRIVMGGFKGWVPDGAPDARAQVGVLSTWSADLKTDTLLIVVQSRVRPDWTGIPRSALRHSVDVRNVDQSINTGDRFTFRTIVNPVRARPDTKNPAGRSKRVPHVRPDHVRRWFEERLHPEGTTVTTNRGIERIGADADRDTLAIRILPPVESDHHKGLKINRAEIRGTLTVTNPATFNKTLATGLGRARAYSCGLILTRPTTN
ncbi:type I-E CRISPR-associated protein Cas6/Cse3/CasE [Streptomyces sp. NPDC003027]